jgi:hypothetical protein
MTPSAVARQVLLLCALIPLACAGVKAQRPAGDAGVNVGGGGSGGSHPGTGGANGTGGGGNTCATPISCKPAGGQYCGIVSDGCAGSQDCGTCPGDQVCDKGLCVGGPSCVPIACGSYCGSIGDGCGHTLTCGSCAAGQVCSGGICTLPGCVPLTCNGPGGARYCDSIGDGCGGTLDCGACPSGGVCGGGGTANVCTNPNCMPVTCTFPSGQYCDKIGDGCGRVLDCGACPGGAVCGGGAMPVPNACPIVTGPGNCVGLQCMVPKCTGTATTSLSGTVYDPAGKVPLYNVTVYVPNAALDPLPEGVSCDKCSAQVSGHPIATALTDANGHFSLTGVPATTNVPLVMQVGKWRRQVAIPTVTACVDNAITDVNLTRLPRSSAEGHLPKIAVTTGGSDALECFLREIGIADNEFTTENGAGRVNLFVGGDPGNPTATPPVPPAGQGADRFSPALGGAMLTNATTLWASVDMLLGYDLLIQSCEGDQYAAVKKPYVANIKRYADAGGRLFNDHLHYYWLRFGPAPWPTTAGYTKPLSDLPATVTALVDTTFPKGVAFGQWLVNTGASTTPGQIQLSQSQHSVTTTTPPISQGWLYIPPAGSVAMSTQYLTINTPVEATPDNQCGRIVVTDIHVKGAGNGDDSGPGPTKAFPLACKAPALTGQSKALEFLFFDLSACLQPDGTMPQPPVVPPPGVPGTPPPSVTTPPPVPPPVPPPPPPPVP